MSVQMIDSDICPHCGGDLPPGQLPQICGECGGAF